ncbi:MAG: hypothetical protein GY948_24510, partial [Alphaproteobacteria bacterium]|nr:hypothetical protein [Alphaproteobacteria bacterium]
EVDEHYILECGVVGDIGAALDAIAAEAKPQAHCFVPHQKGWTESENSTNRFSNADTAVRTVRRPGCAELEHSLSWRTSLRATLRSCKSAILPICHMLFLDGVYARNKLGKTTFQRTNAPDQQELAILVHTISHRVARFLERQGVLERDAENSYLQLEGLDEDPMQQLIGCSVSYRIAVGPQQGRKVLA